MAVKLTKEQKQRQIIADTLVQIQNARENFENLAGKYDQWIDEAADLREDEYSDQLIEEKVETTEMIRTFKFLYAQIQSGATTGAAFSDLKNLPAAISACKGILKQTPRIMALSKEMSSLKESLQERREAMRSLRRQVTDGSDSVYRSLFGERNAMSDDVQRRIEEEKRAREARIASKIARKEAPVSVNAAQDASNSNVDDILRALEEEKKKR